MIPTTRPAHSGPGWLSQLIFGIPLSRPLRCTRCRWTQTRAGTATLTLLAHGRTPRCVWCARPMIQEPPR